MRGFTETATFFPGPDGNALFGVLTTPTGPANGLTLVMLQGGAWIPSMGRNAVSTRIAREQAARGFRAFRFDYHGVGESVGDPPTFRMDNLFVDDLRAAVDWLRTQGCSDFVLMGTCFGARTALAGAPSIPGVRGCALYPPPIRDFAPGQGWVTRPTSWYLSRALRLRVLKGLLTSAKRQEYLAAGRHKVRYLMKRVGKRPAATPAQPGTSRWVSEGFLRPLRELVAARVPVLIVYGEQDDVYEDFTRGRDKGLLAVLEDAGELVSLRVLDGKVHGFSERVMQDRVVSELDDWLGRIALIGARAAS